MGDVSSCVAAQELTAAAIKLNRANRNTCFVSCVIVINDYIDFENCYFIQCMFQKPQEVQQTATLTNCVTHYTTIPRSIHITGFGGSSPVRQDRIWSSIERDYIIRSIRKRPVALGSREKIGWAGGYDYKGGKSYSVRWIDESMKRGAKGLHVDSFWQSNQFKHCLFVAFYIDEAVVFSCYEPRHTELRVPRFYIYTSQIAKWSNRRNTCLMFKHI